MKILYIASEFHWVGASISFLHLLQGMNAKGADIVVVVPNDSPISFNFVRELIKLNIPYFQIPLPWDIENHENLKSTIKALFKRLYRLLPYNGYNRKRELGKTCLRELIQEFQPDIVHTNVGVLHEGFEVCRELGIPHVWHLRDYHDLDFHWRPLPSWDAYKLQLKQTDAVISITDDIRRYYGLWNCSNAQTIYNGCFDANDIAMDFPKEKFFFSASRLIETKGHKDVIKAFNHFWGNHKDYQLILAGIGDENYIAQLKKLIGTLSCRSAVKLIGHQQDVRPWMQKAKALVVASYNEGFGRMTAEAAFCGCLVIGRNTGGTKEILDAIGGFPFEDKDAVNGIYNNMEKVANLSVEDYQYLAENAQRKAVKLYSNESYVEQVYAVYQRLLKKKQL